MSTVVRFKSVRLEILTHDHAPAHVHAIGPDAEAKIALNTLRVIWSYGYSAKALREIVEQIELHHEALLDKWKEYHEGQDEN